MSNIYSVTTVCLQNGTVHTRPIKLDSESPQHWTTAIENALVGYIGSARIFWDYPGFATDDALLAADRGWGVLRDGTYIASAVPVSVVETDCFGRKWRPTRYGTYRTVR